MYKIAELENSGVPDPLSGREFLISTKIRKYFRDNVSFSGESAKSIKNIELNKIIAEYVSKAKEVKNIRTKDGWGSIRKSSELGTFFIISYTSNAAKIISTIEEPKTGPIKGKYEQMLWSGVSDPLTGKQIRTSVTARQAIRKAYPNVLIDRVRDESEDLGRAQVTVGEASPDELSIYLGKVLANNGKPEKVRTKFKLKSGEWAEIRVLGLSNLLAVSIIRDTLDIITIQDTWKSKKVEKGKGPKELSITRPGFRGGRNI